MTELEGLITYIRDFLHDPDKDRYSDSSIVYLLNQAQKDLVKETKCLTAVASIRWEKGAKHLDLPKNLIYVNKITKDCVDIPLVTEQQILDCGKKLCDVGTPNSLLISNTNRHKVTLYPIPIKGSVVFDSMFGIGTGIGTDPYGVVTEGTTEDFNGNVVSTLDGFGIVTTVEVDTVEVTYIKSPDLILVSDIATQELEVDSEYHMALKHYVCGHLLRADKETNSRSLGKEELQLYHAELFKLQREVSTGYADMDLSIDYRGLN